MAKRTNPNSGQRQRITRDLKELSLDDKGRVRIWDVTRKQFYNCYPADAREAIAQGTATVDGPEGVEDVDADGNEGFARMTVSELRQLGIKRGIRGASKMGKVKLVAALERGEATADEADTETETRADGGEADGDED